LAGWRVKESVVRALNAHSICRTVVSASRACKTGEIDKERSVDWTGLADKGVWVEK
jgi:hypothetical protein